MNRLSGNIYRTILRLQDLSITQIAGVHHHKERQNLELFLGIKRSNKAKANRNTHKNERMFRRLRGQKTMVLDLPDDAKIRYQQSLSPDEMRRDMLKDGINPYKEIGPRQWEENQITLQSHYGTLDPFVPPEQPLPLHSLLVPGEQFKTKGTELKNRVLHRFHNWRHGVRNIRKKEGHENFDAKKFAVNDALNIYTKAYESMMTRDTKEICNYVTEHAFSKLWPDVQNGSIFFELVEEVKKPELVSVRCADNPHQSGNAIAQIVVKLHTKQKIAVYDRYGQLILGSKDKIKDVQEFIVFENHISDLDGKWRLHDKVYPSWANNEKEVPIQTGISALRAPSYSDQDGPRVTKMLKMDKKKEDD
uniref:Large ribosomal subunit protein mL45 n=1 Tax=Parastrongyloides trichosuri TaxID=131310 RepID=A0A0N4ZV19_PARTI